MSNSVNEPPVDPQAERQRHESKVAQAILSYLAEHPQAMDSLDGIAEWWLIRQQIRVEIEAVAGAIRQLIEQGLIEEIQSGDTRCYRLKDPGSGAYYSPPDPDAKP